MIGVMILKGRTACLLKIISSHPINIHLHLKDIFKKPLQCLDFCIRLLEFNIYNKTNNIHRKKIFFCKIGLIAPTSENEILSSLIISSTSLLFEESACAKVQKRNFISSVSWIMWHIYRFISKLIGSIKL